MLKTHPFDLSGLVAPESIPEMKEMLQESDFVDFGAKTGASFWIGRRLGGTKGVGVEIREKAVAQAVASGMNVIQGDATELDLPDRSVRISVLNHFLEHLPDHAAAEKAIGTALRISRECVYLGGPVFDDAPYLKELGLKTFWSDWRGHTCHLTCAEVREILARLGVAPESYTLHLFRGFRDSSSEFVHALNAPGNQHEYNAGVHPPKPDVRFSKTLYREWCCIISLNGDRSKQKLARTLHRPPLRERCRIWLRSALPLLPQ